MTSGQLAPESWPNSHRRPQAKTNEFHWFYVESKSFPSKAPDYPEPRENSANEEMSYTI